MLGKLMFQINAEFMKHTFVFFSKLDILIYIILIGLK